MRYASADDFGMPETAFLICRFWLIDAWWVDRPQARRRATCSSTRSSMRNRYGLLSEDIHPETGELWGNFPQTYSMAGLILTAMRLSRSWEDRYWRGSSSVSNRVSVPDERAAGAPAASKWPCKAALKRQHRHLVRLERARRAAKARLETAGDRPADNIAYVVTDLAEEDYKEYYNGFANRVLWPILHYRLDLAEFSRRDLSGYMRVNEHFAGELHKLLQARRRHLGARLSPHAARQGAARARPHEPDRLLPAHPAVRRRKSSPRCRTTSG